MPVDSGLKGRVLEVGQEVEHDADLFIFQTELLFELVKVAGAKVLEMALQQLDGGADIGAFDVHVPQLEEHIFLDAPATGAHGFELADQFERAFELFRFDPGLSFEGELGSEPIEILFEKAVLVEGVDEEVEHGQFVFGDVQEAALPFQVFPEVGDFGDGFFRNFFGVDIVVVFGFVVGDIVVAIFFPVLKILDGLFGEFVRRGCRHRKTPLRGQGFHSAHPGCVVRAPGYSGERDLVIRSAAEG